jgi:hypothetical protein
MEQKGIISAMKSVLKNKAMWKRLLITLAVSGLIAWLALAPKDVPTPWGTCHQGSAIPKWK